MDNIVNTIKEYYQAGKSAKEIADDLGCKEKKLRYLMAKSGIKARSRSDATYIKRNPQGNPFNIIDGLKSPKAMLLFFVSLGLYLGEGTKKGEGQLALSNANPLILKSFLRFLREICRVKESKIFAELNIFDDVDLSEALAYWTQEAGISSDQIRYRIIRKSRGGTYKNKSKYGTLTIKVCNTKLKRIVLEWCDQALEDCLMPL